MNKYIIDFIDISGGWFTYDVYAASVFDAACELCKIGGIKRITSIYKDQGNENN